MPFSIISPVIEDKQEFAWRGMVRRDLPDLWNLLQEVNLADDKDHAETLEDLERQFDDPWSNPLTDGRIIRTLKGKIAAFARIFVSPEPVGENVAYIMCEVSPGARDEGLQQECLDWMQERATERLAESAQVEGAGVLPRIIRTTLPETDREDILLYEMNGFRHIRSFFNMERDLHLPIPDRALPAGLTLRLYDTDLDESMRNCFNEAFSDHWASAPVTEQEWHPFVMDDSNVRKDLTLVVMDGAEVVAFSINRVKTLENERCEIRRGWIGTLGTRRSYRKQGIASALLVESMRRFQALGFDSVGLGVDAENLTGALGLYKGLGFSPYKTKVVLEKRVG